MRDDDRVEDIVVEALALNDRDEVNDKVVDGGKVADGVGHVDDFEPVAILRVGVKVCEGDPLVCDVDPEGFELDTE